ncbi:TetR/AcrR family transcriptional regulator [Halobacillus salinarum]|uniref:TetR/AcrR family transcriptional regulator n=1 Tax=Halobacillus salinarum TaxID=2932257 RepID=A0ABY4EIF3_9BACI|nr:TetR/AcrR family transcriptional regulator [Halobacillus salinarum]UOQ44273.1 TetR/AcrR family transcriptional regulator [Halobacillus salinarum]
MDKRVDPRVIRTRQLLKEAFIELLKEMDIEKITVNRLAERATINRVTFYLHYRDIPDMQEKLADEMVQEIACVYESAKQEANKTTGWKVIEKTLEYIAGNADFYKVVLTSKNIPIFRDHLLAYLTERIVSRMESKDSYAQKVGIEQDFLIWYDSSALIGTIIAWLKNDMPYTPEYMAKQFYLIRNRGSSVEYGKD